MGLISKSTLIKWSRNNKKWYMSKGYIFTKYGDVFLVNIEDLSNGSNACIIAKCDICGTEKEIIYQSYLKTIKTNLKYVCINCHNKNRRGKNLTVQTIFEERIKVLTNNEYEVLSEYKGIKDWVNFRHKECNREFPIMVNNFLKGTRCSHCYNEKMKEESDERIIYYDSLIKNKYKDDFSILSNYINKDSKILIKCLKCSSEYQIGYSTLANRKHRCIKCKEQESLNKKLLKAKEVKPSRIRTPEGLKQEIIKLTDGEYEVLSDFKRSNIPIKMLHKKCGYSWDIRIGDFISKGVRCPQCYIKSRCEELGITIEEWGSNSDQKIRRKKLHRWSVKIKKRDKNICQVCGDSKNTMIAHHLNGWNWDINGREDIKNGVTLCEPCHYNFHKQYRYGGNTKEQFENFKLRYQSGEFDEYIKLQEEQVT